MTQEEKRNYFVKSGERHGSMILCPHCSHLSYPNIYVNNKTGIKQDGLTFLKSINYLATNDFKCWNCKNDLFDQWNTLIWIDELIAPYVSMLNRLGYKTKNCCSGHPGMSPYRSKTLLKNGAVYMELDEPYLSFYNIENDIENVVKNSPKINSLLAYRDWGEIDNMTILRLKPLRRQRNNGIQSIMKFNKALSWITWILFKKKYKRIPDKFNDWGLMSIDEER